MATTCAIVRRCQRCQAILSIYADADATLCWTCEAITEAAAPPPAAEACESMRRSRRRQGARPPKPLAPIADDDEAAKAWRAWRPPRVIGG